MWKNQIPNFYQIVAFNSSRILLQKVRTSKKLHSIAAQFIKSSTIWQTIRLFQNWTHIEMYLWAVFKHVTDRIHIWWVSPDSTAIWTWPNFTIAARLTSTGKSTGTNASPVLYGWVTDANTSWPRAPIAPFAIDRRNSCWFGFNWWHVTCQQILKKWLYDYFQINLNQ